MPDQGYYLSLNTHHAALTHALTLHLTLLTQQSPLSSDLLSISQVLEWLQCQRITLSQFCQLYSQWLKARHMDPCRTQGQLRQGQSEWLEENVPVMSIQRLKVVLANINKIVICPQSPSLDENCRLAGSIFELYENGEHKFFLKPSQAILFYSDFTIARGSFPPSFLDFRKEAVSFFKALGVEDYRVCKPVFITFLMKKGRDFLERVRKLAAKRAFSSDFFNRLVDERGRKERRWCFDLVKMFKLNEHLFYREKTSARVLFQELACIYGLEFVMNCKVKEIALNFLLQGVTNHLKRLYLDSRDKSSYFYGNIRVKSFRKVTQFSASPRRVRSSRGKEQQVNVRGSSVEKESSGLMQESMLISKSFEEVLARLTV